ncbi:hypothetical protein DFH27DRAFT_623910 [Peziza echinospora]|nr:hypothetical protein DFH27DRAFT_623910 [Peziza echinospora]
MDGPAITAPDINIDCPSTSPTSTTTTTTSYRESLLDNLHLSLREIAEIPLPAPPPSYSASRPLRRASVAVILHFPRPSDSAIPSPSPPPTSTSSPSTSTSPSSAITNFFTHLPKDCVPEVLLIKRVHRKPRARKGNRWAGHVALPGGMREEGRGEGDEECVVREVREEVGLELCGGDVVLVGRGVERVIIPIFSTSRPLMLLTPFIYIHLPPTYPSLILQESEIQAAFWQPLETLLHIDVLYTGLIDRLAVHPSRYLRPSSFWEREEVGRVVEGVVRWVGTGEMAVPCVKLRRGESAGEVCAGKEKGKEEEEEKVQEEKEEMVLWGITLDVLISILDTLPLPPPLPLALSPSSSSSSSSPDDSTIAAQTQPQPQAPPSLLGARWFKPFLTAPDMRLLTHLLGPLARWWGGNSISRALPATQGGIDDENHEPPTIRRRRTRVRTGNTNRVRDLLAGHYVAMKWAIWISFLLRAGVGIWGGVVLWRKVRGGGFGGVLRGVLGRVWSW